MRSSMQSMQFDVNENDGSRLETACCCFCNLERLQKYDEGRMRGEVVWEQRYL